jgi:hypothetical protein
LKTTSFLSFQVYQQPRRGANSRDSVAGGLDIPDGVDQHVTLEASPGRGGRRALDEEVSGRLAEAAAHAERGVDTPCKVEVGMRAEAVGVDSKKS